MNYYVTLSMSHNNSHESNFGSRADNGRESSHLIKVGKNGERLTLCHDCSNLGASFSQLFWQLECIRLQLEWKVTKIFETMSCADKVPTRVAAFRTYVEVEDQVAARTSGGVNEGLNSRTVGASHIGEFRKELFNHCKMHMKWSQPKVSLEAVNADAVMRRSNNLEGLDTTKGGLLIGTLEGQGQEDGVKVGLNQLLSFLAILNLLLISVSELEESQRQAVIDSNFDWNWSERMEEDAELELELLQHQEHEEQEEAWNIVDCRSISLVSTFSSQDLAELKKETEHERCPSPDLDGPDPIPPEAQDEVDITPMSSQSVNLYFGRESERTGLNDDNKNRAKLDTRILLTPKTETKENDEHKTETGSGEECMDDDALPIRKSLRSLLKCEQCCKTFSQQNKLTMDLESHQKVRLNKRSQVSSCSSTPPPPPRQLKGKSIASAQLEIPPQSCSSSSDSSSEDEEKAGSSDEDESMDDDDEPKIKRQARAPPKLQNWPKPDHLPVTQCEQCLEHFSCQAAVEKHRLFTHKLTSFVRCQGCGNLFCRYTSLRRHRSNPNFPNCYMDRVARSKLKGGAASQFPRFQIDHATLFCSREGCYEAFAYEEHLQVHLNTHGSWKCAQCELVFEKAHYLAWHEVSNHHHQGQEESLVERRGKSNYKCSRCRVKSKVKRYMIFHFLSKHLGICIIPKGSGKECPICKKVLRSFASVREMEAHISGEHDVSSMDPKLVSKCSICDAPFVYPSSLTLHMSTVHKEAEKTVGCSECLKKFNRRGELVAHIRRIHKADGAALLAKAKPGFTPFQCKVCEEKFEREGFLKTHMKSHAVSALGFTCGVCEARCKTKASLDAHMKNMHEEAKESFCCEECGKIFRSKLKLSLHVGKSHTDPTWWKFKCEVEGCGRMLFTKQRLTAHLRTHTKENPYVCQFCGAAYRYKSTLRAHLQRVHGPSAAATLPKKQFTKPFDKKVRDKESDGDADASNQDGK